MKKFACNSARYINRGAFIVFVISVGAFVMPSQSYSSLRASAASKSIVIERVPTQSASTATPAQSSKRGLPDGDGKAIATEYCQDCHELTNLARASKTADEWRSAINLMMDRGARIPEDKVDPLVLYLTKNFGPQQAAPKSDSQQNSGPSGDANGKPAEVKKKELPEGEGKAIATEYCQDCHRLTNLTGASKTADEWRDTLQLMMDRGARLPDDKVDTLVQYLAKNFGPQASAPANPAPGQTPAPPASQQK
jgi:cytochrome c5